MGQCRDGVPSQSVSNLSSIMKQASLLFGTFALKFLVALLLLPSSADAGIIKAVFQKLTNTNNKTEDVIKQSAPICGSGIFSSPNERSLSPEFIFVTNLPSNSDLVHSDPQKGANESRRVGRGSDGNGRVTEVAKEFRFHAENVTLRDLEEHGFNREAPVSFLIHGFTSGYPLQAWISAIVESYTLDRETNDQQDSYFLDIHGHRSKHLSEHGIKHDASRHKVNHNLFIINWNYAARGIVYPRAVANLPIVATYAARFINKKLIEEAMMDPRDIQLIGHSLGAHLSGYIGKNTRSKLGRIYGLDPAGPCFGTLVGALFPSSQRLAPTDAEEVITIHTNSAMLGIDKPLGRYSVYVEGGENQPGCRDGSVLSNLGLLTFDGADFDDLSCSHSRAPNLLTFRLDQSQDQEQCQLVAYECTDWEAFRKGYCGVCREITDSGYEFGGDRRARNLQSDNKDKPLRPVECLRIGLDWQYSKKFISSNEWSRPNSNDFQPAANSNDRFSSSSTRAPKPDPNQPQYQGDTHVHGFDTPYTSNPRRATIRPGPVRTKRGSSNENNGTRQSGEEVKSKKMYIKTADTQPYCTYHYQVVLELNEPFPKNKKPPISLIMQDSQVDPHHQSGGRHKHKEFNSLTNDNFGNKYSDKIYTHLMTSGKKLDRIDHATLLFREGLPDGYRILKHLHINYMSHIDLEVRNKYSSRLCLVQKDVNHNDQDHELASQSRYYFEACEHHL